MVTHYKKRSYVAAPCTTHNFISKMLLDIFYFLDDSLNSDVGALLPVPALHIDEKIEKFAWIFFFQILLTIFFLEFLIFFF